MAYEFQIDESLSAGVRRVAHEQFDDALGLLEQPAEHGIETAVHRARKACKKVRGLVRLVRPAMGDDYHRANVAVRDAARELSSLRDAHALLATFDDLVAAHPTVLTARSARSVRSALAHRADAASRELTGSDQRLLRARHLLTAERDRVARWALSDDVDIVAGGVAKTYARGRALLAECLDEATDERLHQWRKRTKYSWYHVRLLRPCAPSVLGPLGARLHDLSDGLGDDHDLAVLGAQLTAAPDDFGGAAVVTETIGVLAGRRADLQRRSRSLGVRLYVEPPEAFAERVAGYWTVWRRHGTELAVGELADLAADDTDEHGDSAAGPDAALRSAATAALVGSAATIARLTGQVAHQVSRAGWLARAAVDPLGLWR